MNQSCAALNKTHTWKVLHRTSNRRGEHKTYNEKNPIEEREHQHGKTKRRWKSETREEANRALITIRCRIISDLGWDSSWTKMGTNPRTKWGKWRTSIGDFFGTRGNHATWM